MPIVERPRDQQDRRSRDDLIRHAATTLRNARRARNGERGGLPDELRCECAQPSCRATFPVAAQTHRRRPERYIVVPSHLAGETVVGAADRFFIVEPPARPAALNMPARDPWRSTLSS